jgi:hypothetical protein
MPNSPSDLNRRPPAPKEFAEPYWLKQKGESQRAYQMWRFYLDGELPVLQNSPEKPKVGQAYADAKLRVNMRWNGADWEAYHPEPGGRSHAKVARAFGISKTRVDVLGRTWRWQERLVAWEKKEDEERQETERKNRAAMVKRQREMGKSLQIIVWNAIKKFVEGDNPLTWDLDPYEARALMETGVRIERQAWGEPIEEARPGETATDHYNRVLGAAQKAFRDSKHLMPTTPKERRRDMTAYVYGVEPHLLKDEDE